MGIFGRCMWEIHMGDLMHSIHSHLPNAKIPGPASVCHPQPWRMILVPRPPVSHVRQYFPGMFRAGPPCRGIAWKSIAWKSIARNGAVSTAGGAGYRSTLGQAETGLSRGGSLAKSPHISAEMAQRDHYPLRIYSMGIKGETEFS